MTKTTLSDASRPHEFIGVFKIINQWIPIHVKGSEAKIVAKHPVTDLSIALVAAQQFAQMNQVEFYPNPIETKKPWIIAAKWNNDFYPACLCPERGSILFGTDQVSFKCATKDQAEEIAKRIAIETGAHFVKNEGEAPTV